MTSAIEQSLLKMGADQDIKNKEKALQCIDLLIYENIINSKVALVALKAAIKADRLTEKKIINKFPRRK